MDAGTAKRESAMNDRLAKRLLGPGRIALAAATAAALSACAAPEQLSEYRPIVDAGGVAFEADLAHCRAIATAAEADYRKRQNDAMAANLIVGVLAGAALGNAIGGNSDWTAYGAVNGAAAGVASVDTELAHGGPRRVIDRCLLGRGHRVLSDVGVG